MTDLEKAARMSLEALEYYQHRKIEWDYSDDAAITALRQALSNSVEQPAQQQEWRGPVDWEEVAADYAKTIAMMKAEQEAAVLAEREACARVCENPDLLMNSTFQGVAEAIRARGEEH